MIITKQGAVPPEPLAEAPPYLVKRVLLIRQFLECGPGRSFTESERAGPMRLLGRLERLISDPRMRSVYRRLKKRERDKDDGYKQGDYVYKGKGFAYRNQEESIAGLIIVASLFPDSPPTLTKNEIHGRRQKFGQLAEDLKQVIDAKWLSHEKDRVDLIKLFRDAAEHAERLSGTLHENIRPLGKPRSLNASRTKYLRELAGVSRGLFGSLLPGTLATVANVALDRSDITEATVRGAVKKR